MASKSGTDSETATGFLVFVVSKDAICIVPTLCVTAIKLSVYRNAKLQLGIGNLRAKLGLGLPSRADFTP